MPDLRDAWVPGLRLRVGWGLGALCDRGADVRRGAMQTLLVSKRCGGVLGLLSGLCVAKPRVASLRLG